VSRKVSRLAAKSYIEVYAAQRAASSTTVPQPFNPPTSCSLWQILVTSMNARESSLRRKLLRFRPGSTFDHDVKPWWNRAVQTPVSLSTFCNPNNPTGNLTSFALDIEWLVASFSAGPS